MSEENKHWMESDETAQMRIAQAQALKTQAAESGLRFDAFLVPANSISKCNSTRPDMRRQAAIAWLPIVPARMSGINATLFAAHQ